ncbi:MAG: Asp-tRNA(Asn)/Glu-tRNA(Gln) amidotransferase subunit GatB [Gammaproteobacteria bacterium]|nr:Asp-tRNA(Asn)/Glu-tRNA(Gln) amidotransferase subunit GatB [Gammaproteobacteria bacterium]
MQWETVIGLEVHTQLNTTSKIFSGAACHYGAEPNTQACGIDIGLPGVLPVLNKKVLELAVRFGLSIDADIPSRSVFARKNYFYPDLPKGYQISQFDLPIVAKGSLNILLEDGREKTIGITRAHLEEDAGKSLHEAIHGNSGVDLNRAGTPLLEIVSEPDIRSAEEAVAYLKTLHRLVRYLNISDGNMQEGSFRCDVNISIRPQGTEKLGTRTEYKNMNSFRFIERAIAHEVDRQIDILENGGKVVQETRAYDPDKDSTRTLRLKEEAHDYRYFPDPDLLPVTISPEFIAKIRQELPELPWQKRERFKADYQLSDYDAKLLANHLATAQYFENTLQYAGKAAPKVVANWVNGELAAALNKADLKINDSPISAEQLGGLLTRVADQTISNNIAKKVFSEIWEGKGNADKIIEAQGLKQITDSGAIEKIVDEVIANSPTQLQQYRDGKTKLFGYFVGQVMQKTKGKANPQQVNELLRAKLT